MAFNFVQAVRRLFSRMSASRPTGPIDMDDPIGGALRDAELLIAFAAQSNRKIDAQKVSQLIHAAAQVSGARAASQVLDPAQSSAFWAAYDAVAMEMAPLSAHSIRSSLRLNAHSIPRSIGTHHGVNAWIALAVFFVCVGLQVFWVAGKDLIERSEVLEKERVELEKKMLDDALALAKAELQMSGIECGILSGKSSDGSPCSPRLLMLAAKVRPDAPRMAAIRAEMELLHRQASERTFQAHQTRFALDAIRARGRPVEALLQRWHARVQAVCGWPVIQVVCLAGESGVPAGVTLKSSLADLRRQAGRIAIDTRQPLLMPAYLADMEKRLAEGEKFDRMLLETRLTVANIGTYLIAMVMGVLGALTFILRTTSQQLREHTYVPVSISTSMVRICLGAIAGVFGSLLMPNGDPTLKSLPPLFIPFLFGYAIEILFSLMDKLVNNFTKA